MSIHYAIDPFATNNNIVYARVSQDGTSPSTGFLIIRVPDGAILTGSPPRLLSDVLSAKYAALAAQFPGYTMAVSDACLDPSRVNATGSFGVILGNGVSQHSILPGNGQLTTNTITLSASASKCVVLWEVYSFTDTDDRVDRYKRTYVEAPVTDLNCSVSLDSGAHFTSASAGLPVTVSPNGTGLVVRFATNSSARRYLGSWAVLVQ